MKKIYLLLFVFFVTFSINLKAQSTEADGDVLQTDTIIKTDTNLKAPFLYAKGIEWFVTTFINSKAVLQMKDKDAAIIVGKSVFTGEIPAKGLIPKSTADISYFIKLYFKDGKVRVIITGFTPGPSMGFIRTGNVTKWQMMTKDYSIKSYEAVRAACKVESQNIILQLKEYYAQTDSSKDW